MYHNFAGDTALHTTACLKKLQGAKAVYRLLMRDVAGYYALVKWFEDLLQSIDPRGKWRR